MRWRAAAGSAHTPCTSAPMACSRRWVMALSVRAMLQGYSGQPMNWSTGSGPCGVCARLAGSCASTGSIGACSEKWVENRYSTTGRCTSRTVRTMRCTACWSMAQPAPCGSNRLSSGTTRV